MLIRVSMENWMSFRDKTTFSMIATRERQHGSRVPKIGKFQMKILPIASIYGGNASGKSNFLQALQFMKDLVTNPLPLESPIPVDPFLLGSETMEQPSRFTFELLIDEIIYRFQVALNKKEILEEKLEKITSTNEILLYQRQGPKIEFNKSVKDKKFLEFAFKGTRPNQLFLTNSVYQNIDLFKSVYDWFKSLLLIAPDSSFAEFASFLKEENPLFASMNSLLQKMDTGILDLKLEELPLNSIPIDDFLKNKLHTSLKEGSTLSIRDPKMNQRFYLSQKKDQIVASKLVCNHMKTDGTAMPFDFLQESDGSQRLIDLLPAFLFLGDRAAKQVIIIDELDRSLHSLLLRQLLETYLSNCTAESRSQLLFTTHDILTMDQTMLRRDEMWVTERDVSGATTLYSFSDFKDVRNDKDIQKSYLQGRLGGIPRISLPRDLKHPKHMEVPSGKNHGEEK